MRFLYISSRQRYVLLLSASDKISQVSILGDLSLSNKNIAIACQTLPD